jgi:GGDEF domain-containing protein
LLGAVRGRESVRRTGRIVFALTVVAFGVAWGVPPADALRLGIGVAFAIAALAFIASAASIRRGERAGWFMLVALPCCCMGMAVLDWYAFHPDRTPWPLHALSAIAGIAYLLCIAIAMWTRYAYLIEVSRVMTHGPNFDPVTSMASYESGQPMGEPFAGSEGRLCGIIVVSISNLKVLEELHGRAAYNHALFVCASRLRHTAPSGVELARLREDAFLLVVRYPRDAQQMIEHARRVMQRLSRPVKLGTSRDITALEASHDVWQASLGVGVLVDTPGAEPAITVAGARAMSRTAWSFPSRMAWYDEAAGSIAELPATG